MNLGARSVLCDALLLLNNDTKVIVCPRIRQAGSEIVCTPGAELLHNEGSSRWVYEDPDDRDVYRSRWLAPGTIDPDNSPMCERDRPFVLKI
jgi:hypothetical protein